MSEALNESDIPIMLDELLEDYGWEGELDGSDVDRNIYIILQQEKVLTMVNIRKFQTLLLKSRC